MAGILPSASATPERRRSLGSARAGSGHWWMQRVSALALIPLTLWLVASIVALSGADLAATRAWFGTPLDATLACLLLVATFYHASLGLRVVIEDYVHGPVLKHGLIILANFAAIVAASLGLLAVVRIALGG